MNDHRIAAVFFDFGGVLLQRMDGIDHQGIESRLGLPGGTLFRCLYRDSRWKEVQVGRCTVEEWQESVRQAMTRAVGSQADALYHTYRQAERPLNRDVIALIGRLRPQYRTGVISNTVPGLERRLREEFDIAGLFDVLVGSGDLGVAKPQPGIYLHAAGELGLPPERCVFIDDVQALADGATAVGMAGFRFTSFPQLLADLGSLGVRV